ncbi:MAG TPA: hypothetical protein VLJ38_00385, partial [Polyangiaceae bacterium]|nr:hypothetical protein [Polyangiaceae bacterium]
MLLTLLSYLPALHGGFVWDDDSWTIRLGSLFHDSSGLGSIWLRPTAMQQYYPLSGTTFWVDYQLWGFRPFPYHWENVLLHASSALLFWRVLRRLEVQGAWLASAVFALHPVMVESVAWIAERKNVLAMVLCLAAALAYLRYELAAEPAELRPVEVQTAGARSRPVRRQAAAFYVLAWLLFLAALLAKTFVCTFPAVILLLAWWRRGRLRWRHDVLPTLPFFAVAIGMCALTAWLEKNH